MWNVMQIAAESEGKTEMALGILPEFVTKRAALIICRQAEKG